MPFNGSEEEGCSCYSDDKGHHVPVPSTQWLKITYPQMSDDSAIPSFWGEKKGNLERAFGKISNSIIYLVKLWVVKLFKESCW